MARDDEEFAAVFSQIYPGLCRFLDCLLGGRRADAQDIAQETFMRFYRSAWERVPPEEARFWLYRVARNLALNELNKGRTQKGLWEQVATLFHREGRDAEATFARNEQREIIAEMLASLPEQQRVALLLREQEEMSYREIASTLNVTESKVKVDIFRARGALRAKWKETLSASRV